MKLDSIQASLRHSSRKRACPTILSSPEAADDEAPDTASRWPVPRKYRAVGHSNTGTPLRESATRAVARPGGSPTRATASSAASPAVQTPTTTSSWSHEDPVPADCCFLCRRRGGNYAYTCIYEDDSGNCKRCIKEKHRCRRATADEIAKSEARCPQCKKRGLSNCWYEAGKSSCEPCIKWNKTCGAPTKRIFNANTRSFMGLPTPEPEQSRLITNGEETAGESSRSETAASGSRAVVVLTASSATVSSRAHRSNRQSMPTTAVPPESDSEGTTVMTRDPDLSNGSGEAFEDITSRKARSSTGSGKKAAKHGATLLNSTLVRGSRKTSVKVKSLASTLMIQEATPDDSALEGAQPIGTDVDMADDESAALQLITENTNMVTLPDFADTSVRDDVDAAQASMSDSDDDIQSSSTSRHLASGADSLASRFRVGRNRPSYVELVPSDASDNELEKDDDEVWDPNVDVESIVDDDEEFEDAAQSSADEEAEETETEFADVSIEPEPTSVSRRRSQPISKQDRGLDLNLPPLDNISEIIEDMTSRAVELGLPQILKGLGDRPINVATMCSGTESPLLFLQMLSEALDARGEPLLRVKHHFSAEIDTTKQAYIERNFRPPILFRDVRQLGDEDTTTATTAYGAEEKIPGDLDILVAGFVCKDLSPLNSREKTVDDQGETGDTWRAIYFYAKRFQPAIVLLENVKSDKRTWDDVVSRWSKVGYEAAWTYCDTKNYYLPQTRQRMYMIAVNRKLYGKGAKEAVTKWQATMEKLQRQCSSPYEAFLVDLPVSAIDHPPLSSEPDWSLCKLRYDQIRSEQRLGSRRPITQWSENGTLHPPDYANRKWYDSQSSRVYDAIDVAHLLAAQDGYDSMSKMQIWDVSQNVDRFKTGMGLMPCITPGGCDFANDRQDALNGSQTLVLQGMPLNKLHFAGETQRERQDLAGNAMSTTVIGASLISAILHGHRAFRSSPLVSASHEESQQRPVLRNRLVRASTMEGHTYSPTDPKDLSIEHMLNEAFLTSQLCACEGEQQTSESVIKVCSECGHTACSVCASNPRHKYVDSIARDDRRQMPSEFVRSLRAHLPSRLKLQNFPALEDTVSNSTEEENRNNGHVKRIADAKIDSRQFTLGRFVRCEKLWRIIFESDDVRLELSLGETAQWLLFVDSLPNLPSNSELRKSLKTPIACGAVKQSLLDVDWDIFVPSYQEHSIRLRGSIERSKSWRNQLGLPNFQAETVPTKIHVRSDGEDTSMLDGDYTHLPHCGTAEASLYKSSAEPALYLFLDPNPIGDARNDPFVFSRDCSRKRWGESRMIVARLDPAWRPWQMQNEDEEYIVETTPSGVWLSMPMQLTASQLTLTAQVLPPGTPLTNLPDKCTDAVTVLDVAVSEQLPIEQFGQFSWALEQVKTAPSLDEWQSIDIHTQSSCLCSPAYPELLWSVDDGGKATPHEDRKAAATFERGVKSRCPIFHEQSSVTAKATRIGIGINISSLVHRAKGRLIRSMGHARDVKGAWRLLTDHASAGPTRFPKFHLRSNASDAQFSGQLRLEHELRGAQPQALTWMHNQEVGLSLKVTETEEAVHEGLGWRAEARAESTVQIRGGVLADLPSFGKTVTTIALIQSEFEELSPEAIVEDNQSKSKQLPQLIDTAATLIVCPPHIAMQWQAELELFLGDEQFEEYSVRVVRDFAELRSLSIDAIKQSRVIVISWTVLADDDYISELAWVTAMPEPANSSCRAFDAWMDGVSKDLPSQVQFLQSMALNDFAQATQDLLEMRLEQPEFQATLPLRLQHGSKYQSYETVRVASTQKKSAKPKPFAKRKSSGSNGKVVPLLHLFRFNRLVVDEYHYLNDYKKMKNMFTAISVKKVAAHKRWILSGTPALANFTDVDDIASFLGVRLGRFAVQSTQLTPLEDFLVNDQTAVERFLSKTETMSQAWHRARHDRAQEFLDQFVRQNEASLGHIPCHEELRAVDMDLAHHAVYLELSQHLRSQRMQVKRLRNKGESDRVSRLNASLNNSKTAEDALLKAALVYETSAGESGLNSLVRKRSEQRSETEREISRLMRAFEWHKRTGFKDLKPTDSKKAEKEENTVPKLWISFAQDIRNHAWLGDFDATLKAKLLLSKAEMKPTPGGLEELKGVSKEKLIKEAKTAMSHMRDSCVELALRTRSERFISNVKALLQPLCEGSDESISCDAENCQQTATIAEIYLASQCGHLTCRPCLLARGDDENCVVTGCSCTIQAVSLIKATDLGSTPEKVMGHSFGRKMDNIARLIKKLPNHDQGLVFAPNEETIVILGSVLEHHNIAYSTPNGNSRQAAKIIEAFKASVHEDPEDRPKVLLLNLTSETAAGVNLTNANHIIFVSPLLVESQYKYDSAMTQAIARSRRYGQEKQVQIYHFVALRTIDVDILEHRHKRANGITATKSKVRMPPESLTTPEKTKLVKNKHGSMALVPISWLVDEETRKSLDVDKEPESFTSLINFSETFEDGEE